MATAIAAFPAVAQVSIPTSPAALGAGNPAGAPVAEVKVFAASRQKAVWSGEGSSAVVTDLCVASTSGRFQLQIVSQSGGALIGPGKLPYVIHFRDGSGLDHVQRVDGQAIVTFEGNAPDTPNCDAGPNATLAIETSEGDMLSQSAGEYFDRLQLIASPL